jgi:hypothetical protein
MFGKRREWGFIEKGKGWVQWEKFDADMNCEDVHQI